MQWPDRSIDVWIHPYICALRQSPGLFCVFLTQQIPEGRHDQLKPGICVFLLYKPHPLSLLCCALLCCFQPSNILLSLHITPHTLLTLLTNTSHYIPSIHRNMCECVICEVHISSYLMLHNSKVASQFYSAHYSVMPPKLFHLPILMIIIQLKI